MLKSPLMKIRYVANSMKSSRLFSDHSHHGPHVPEGYAKLGKCCLVLTYLWVFYRLKEDKGQLFGFYKPWLHEHEHEHHVQYKYQEIDEMPVFADDDENEDEDE